MSAEHPVVKAAAAKMTTAKINVSSTIVTILKIVIPFLGPALGQLLQSGGAAKYKVALIEARDVLIAANLGDAD